MRRPVGRSREDRAHERNVDRWDQRVLLGQTIGAVQETPTGYRLAGEVAPVARDRRRRRDLLDDRLRREAQVVRNSDRSLDLTKARAVAFLVGDGRDRESRGN